ncbi:MAG: nicotinate-nucleotide adenylyltransferase [Chloroflexi bacterium]|nr:nicotinate-nucleotide adenylyltransferase [Chloroflexota bacterium]
MVGGPAVRPGRRVGVLGGSFNPPHLGHLIAAQEAAASLELERVLFVPAGVQPLKRGERMASAEDRVRMVELAIADNPLFALSRADVDRPGPSFTVDLLALLQRQLGPEVELSFIVGADSLAELARWKDPARLLELCRLVAVPRPGYSPAEPIGLGLPNTRMRDRLLLLPIPSLDISSTELRARVREGRPIRYLVPDAVARYIRERGLYTGGD